MKYYALLMSMCWSMFLFSEKGWYKETLYDEWAQTFEMQRILYEEKTEYQDLIIFENPFYGRVLALDGIIQLTEQDEFTYHEMMAHVPLLAHGSVKSVLIIGGGDGGVAREVLKHNTVERVTLVDIDQKVIDFSKEYLPFVSQGAYDDPRLHVVIADGNEFVRSTNGQYDVIICDSPDPIGAAAVLFTEGFYAACRDRLAHGGIFVTQNGVPFLQTDELRNTHQLFSKLFANASFYTTVVPTYVGGMMTLGWASKGIAYDPSVEEIRKRLETNVTGSLKYYTPDGHKAAFALPQFIKDVLTQE